MNTTNALFEEKQYLGYNRYTLVRRSILALFCFIAYFMNQKNPEVAQLFLLAGIVILVISIGLFFVVHLQTRVFPESIVINGVWSSRKVMIDLHRIVKVERIRYSNYLINNPVYNLHKNGVVRFFTGGKNEAVKIEDVDGRSYLIGVYKAEEFIRIIKREIDKKKLALI